MLGVVSPPGFGGQSICDLEPTAIGVLNNGEILFQAISHAQRTLY